MIARLKNLLTDPRKRPQLILWSGVVLVVGILLVAGSVIGTSTNWFCTGPCHTVHDDNTLTFNKSSHVMVSCIACHEPLNGSPLTFILKKIEVAPDLFPTVLGTFTLPMNDLDDVAREMPDENCTQCHNLKSRKVTSSAGLIINHDVHTAKGISCTSCHNRVAHPEEGVTYTLKGDAKHEDWLSMDACFRCHNLDKAVAKAPGACPTCHTPDFSLVPESHAAKNWYAQYGDSSGHGAAASEEASRVVAAEKRTASLKKASHGEGEELSQEQAVNTCYTCHEKSFCTNCHGVEMPHPADFAKSHGQAGLSNPASCAKCHARSATEAASTQFCNGCHHPDSSPDKPWVDQHFVAVRDKGVDACLDCHNPRYCSACHVDGPEAARRYLQEQSGQ